LSEPRIQKVVSSRYGEYYIREIGKLDVISFSESDRQLWVARYHPGKFFYTYFAQLEPNGLTQPTVITWSVPLRMDNLSWVQLNKDCEYSRDIATSEYRVRHMPIAASNNDLSRWLKWVLPYLSQDWVDENKWIEKFI